MIRENSMPNSRIFIEPNRRSLPHSELAVRRIIKALVDAKWLSDLDQKLTEYKAHADGTS